jgi:proteasome lid subunit RPN8/RPN11
LRIKFNKGRIIEYLDDIKLVLTKDHLNQLKACVQNAYPNEACGIIIGDITQISNQALQDDFFYHYIANKFSCIKSDRKSAVSFLIENIEELHQIILKSRAGLDIKERTRLISIFHSHPSGNHPSMTDIENMKFLDTFSDIDHKFVSKAFKNLIWLIMDGTLYELNGFIYLNRSLYQIEIKIN